MSLDDVPDVVSLSEAALLTEELCKDPSSHTAAAANGWPYPLSREALALMDLRDAFVLAHTPQKHRGSFKPYPRPWDTRTPDGRPAVVSDAAVRAALRARGHDV